MRRQPCGCPLGPRHACRGLREASGRRQPTATLHTPRTPERCVVPCATFGACCLQSSQTVDVVRACEKCLAADFRGLLPFDLRAKTQARCPCPEIARFCYRIGRRARTNQRGQHIHPEKRSPSLAMQCRSPTCNRSPRGSDDHASHEVQEAERRVNVGESGSLFKWSRSPGGWQKDAPG